MLFLLCWVEIRFEYFLATFQQRYNNKNNNNSNQNDRHLPPALTLGEGGVLIAAVVTT